MRKAAHAKERTCVSSEIPEGATGVSLSASKRTPAGRVIDKDSTTGADTG